MNKKLRKDWINTSLSELLVTKNDKSKQIKSTEYRKVGAFPIVDQSAKFICGFSDEASKVIKSDLPITIFGDHTRHTKFVFFPFVAGADGTQLLKPKKGIHDKFFYYLVSFAANKIGNYGYDRHFKHLKDFQWFYPTEMAEQSKIAEIITSIDRTIAKTEALIEKYQQIKAGLMHDLFTRGIGADGKLRSPREEAPELYQETAIGWIPKEWKVDLFGDNIEVIDPNPSHRYPSEVEDGYPICSTENFEGEDNFNFGKSKFVPETTYQAQNNKCRFKSTDVIFARKGKIGLARRYGQDKKAFSHTVVVMKPSSKSVDNNWLLWLSRSDWLLKSIELTMNTNSGVPTLGVEFIKNIAVPFPKDAEQKIMNRLLEFASHKIQSECTQKEKLQKQKSGLMHDLLTGKVSVNVDSAP
jgi:type I restriction enzyme, S subunit